MTFHSPILAEDESLAETSPIRVMLIDDSPVARSIFARLLSRSGLVEVVAEAEDCAAALDSLRTLRVDVILLDIEMPQRTGLDALPEILDAADGARVIVVSSFVEENGPAAIQALSLGACDTLAKPGRTGFGGRFPNLLVDKVVRLGRSARLAPTGTGILMPDRRSAAIARDKPDCIAIGASTGGIPVIYEIIRNLPAALDCPVLVAQHLPDAFIEFFARQLQAQTKRKICVPTPGERIEKGVIYLAPGSGHLICSRQGDHVYADRLDRNMSRLYNPSVDALFESVAQSYGSDALAIILSGMGNDGLKGARRLAACGASIIVQDQRSSVVWGMPGAVVRSGLADAIYSPARLVRHLARLAG